MPNRRFTPLVIAVSLVCGILLGAFLTSKFSRNRLSIINTSSNKISDLLHIVDARYVDTISISQIVEQAMPQLIAQLDPHSTYIPASEAEEVNQELKGSFSGIGVQFTIRNDTVVLSDIIRAGPAEKAGALAGDRLIAVDGNPYTGDSVTNRKTMSLLRGEKGTTVRLTLLRGQQTKEISITRDDIPVHTVEAAYMLSANLGYIKITSFGETTYAELLTALTQLQAKNFRGLVLDLRDNGGGYLGAAVQVVNEFLPNNQLIVYTEGRKARRQEYSSDGRGSYQQMPLIVLTDEQTASAAEIVSGAIQDNDRGILIGRRTFGKGLVQEPIDFADGSLLHLTVARYYTPSGRCIQKPYQQGKTEEYLQDLNSRYQHGEYFSSDSIHLSGPEYTTSIGRTVYGGGGIMPDYFVPEDTSLVTPWLTECLRAGLTLDFCFQYNDQHRTQLKQCKDWEKLLKHLRSERVVQQFIDYTDQQQFPRRNNQIRKSQPLIERAIYAGIIYNALGFEEYTKYYNSDDPAVALAIQLFDAHQTKPTLNATQPAAETDVP